MELSKERMLAYHENMLLFDLFEAISPNHDTRVLRDDQLLITADLRLENGERLRPETATLIRRLDDDGCRRRIVIGLDIEPSAGLFSEGQMYLHRACLVWIRTLVFV